MKKRVAIIENICERRLLEYDRFLQYLRINQVELCSDLAKADFLFFFSCGMKEMDTYHKVEEGLKLGLQVVVIGCAASMLSFDKKIKKFTLQNIHNLDQLINPQIPYDSIPQHKYSSYNRSSINKYCDAVNTWDPRLFTPSCHDVYSVKVSEGCSRCCSYCAIHNATGKLKSVPVENIALDISRAVADGYMHFRLQCENLSAYGEDIGTDLGALLGVIGKLDADFDIDLPDLHPDGFFKYYDSILNFMSQKHVYQLHIPIQSGSNEILKKMNRNYDVDKLVSKIKWIRKLYPDLILGTDIIVGFPGESESDFEKTCKLLSEIYFNPLYIHGYCDKEGTAASKMNGKVLGTIIEKRICQLQSTYPYAASFLNDYYEGRTVDDASDNGESTIQT